MAPGRRLRRTGRPAAHGPPGEPGALFVIMAWERWQSLPPERKEHYKRQARQYTGRGRRVLDQRRGRRPPPR